MSDTQLSGIINVNKPGGWTSFDVIAKLRGILHIKRLGHAGTLDPIATGVLPVFVGSATKACDIIPDRKKEYLAGFRLGISTDTQDITGEILTQSGNAADLSSLTAALQKQLGDIMQLPPMYSAVKVDGKKLYELARAGKTVKRTPRPVHIDSIEIIEYDEKSRSGKMLIKCEKGVYIRTLINDIGQTLDTGGVMTSLVRTYSSGFSLDECKTIEEISEAAQSDTLKQMILPIDKAFECYKKITLNERITGLYKNGVKLRAQQVGAQCPDERTYRVYGFDGEFLGLGYFDKGVFRSKKNFYR